MEATSAEATAQASRDESIVVEHGHFFDFNPDVRAVHEDNSRYYIITEHEHIAYAETGEEDSVLLLVKSGGDTVIIRAFLLYQAPDHDTAISKIAELEERHGEGMFEKWAVPEIE